MEIRRIEPGDENWVSNLIRKTISISNIKDYPKEPMDALIAVRAHRIEIPASITGVPFYLKMGYKFKNGISEPDEEYWVRMEKNK